MVHFSFSFFFEIGFCFVAQTDLGLTITLTEGSSPAGTTGRDINDTWLRLFFYIQFLEG
jgi:hypothetical protein